MKIQIVSLILSAAVLAASPAFAMEEDHTPTRKGGKWGKITVGDVVEPREYTSSRPGFDLEEFMRKVRISDEELTKKNAEAVEKRAKQISGTLGEMRHEELSRRLTELEIRQREENAHNNTLCIAEIDTITTYDAFEIRNKSSGSRALQSSNNTLAAIAKEEKIIKKLLEIEENLKK